VSRLPLVAGLLAFGVMVGVLLTSWWQSAQPAGSRSAEISYFCKVSALNQGGHAGELRAACLTRTEPHYVVVGFAIGLALLAVAAGGALWNRARTAAPAGTGPLAA
jgi:hypothetical protein